jgi:PglZ domain
MEGANGNGAPPLANRSVVEGELRRVLRRRPSSRNSVLLLRAAPQWRDDTDFGVDIDGSQIRVAVAACPTVLAVLDALSTCAEDRYLVVLTPCGTHEVGNSVLARAIVPEIKPINRWDLVRDAFGARQADPRLVRSDKRWLAEALLDAQPAGGWRRLAGPVLTLATAMNRLVAIRLGMDAGADDSGVDAAALLEWTCDGPAVSTFMRLRDKERDEIIAWLRETIGPVAEVVFGMSAPGRITDAVPFGLAAAALYGQEGAVTVRVRAEERYFAGCAPSTPALRAFGEAAESLVTRWTDNGHAPLAATMCERAELILADLGNRELARESNVLDAGLDARLVALAEAIGSSLSEAESALRRVRDHGRGNIRENEVAAAEAAVRVARWLAAQEEPPATLADGAMRMLRSWGWADRALGVIARADTSRVPRLATAYAKLWDTGKARRAQLDEAFARKLANWTHGSATTTDLLLVEDLMERIARPVAAKRLPVIIVLDGMSVAVACELADELATGGLWMEAGRRQDGREPALATVPSITSISRTSLLTGTLRSGGQPEENSGFAAFWGRYKSRLFHKGDLGPVPGQALSAEVRDAILDPETIVGMVLNAIDDTLDKGKPGGAGHWTVESVTYLRPVLDEARRAGRPVILTADHGHVLDRGQEASRPADSDRARYRTGTPGAGETRVRGPRVITGGGEVVAAVDEAIHYTPRRAGYHGGASSAEVVVPVIVLLPSASLLPVGWADYDAVGHAPSWWDPPVTLTQPPAGPPARSGSSPRKRPSTVVPDDANALFGFGEVAEAGHISEPASDMAAARTSLGAQVIASGRMADQRQFARRAPDNARVAALIDGLEQAGGRVTIAEAARITGESPVRMSGYLAQVARLLNVDGYRVIGTTDGGRTVELNTQLLRQQFL